jgi:transcriptional regulator with XRE-family HTH domain
VDRPANRTFGHEVRRLLAEREMTLRALAARVGVDPGYLVRVLQGKQPPSSKLVANVCEAFDLPPFHFAESRREAVQELVAHDPGVVDALFYGRVSREAGDAGSGEKYSPADPLDDPLAVLTHHAGDERLARLAAAVLVRYEVDHEFRRAAEAQVPGIKTLASALSEKSARSTRKRS